MATDLPDINLGSVGFQLLANTESLERSLGLLERFGGLVNRATASINEDTAAWTRQQQTIERTLSGQFSAVERLNTRYKALGKESSDAIKDVNTTFERLNQTLTSGELRPGPELTRGFQGMQAAIARTTQA